MQTNITDKNIIKSVSNLDNKRLFSNIYENIHGFASLLGINDKLVNPVKNISNKPQCKMWIDYEYYLYKHIIVCYNIWYDRIGYKKCSYTETINYRNIQIIESACSNLPSDKMKEWLYPEWVNVELIEIHRSHLIQKEIAHEEKFNKVIQDKLDRISDIKDKEKKIIESEKFKIFLDKKIKELYYYRDLFPYTPKNLKMIYKWR